MGSVKKNLPAPVDSAKRGYGAASTNLGNYAIFAGGNDAKSNVDAFNTSLIRSSLTSLSNGRPLLTATHIGNYAIFAGGPTGGEYVYASPFVDAYNTSLTKVNISSLSNAKGRASATHVGNYAIIGSGVDNSSNDTNTVETYNTSLTKGTASDLSYGGDDNNNATHIGNYALFGGESLSSSIVSVYNTSLTKSTVNISSVRDRVGTSSSKNYALFINGAKYNNSKYVSVTTIDAFNSSLTKTTIDGEPGTIHPRASYIEEGIVIGGGYTRSSNGSTSYKDTVVFYNNSLTKTLLTIKLSSAGSQNTATHVGDFVIFSTSDTSTMDAFYYCPFVVKQMTKIFIPLFD